jgi:hypothetical protein
MKNKYGEPLILKEGKILNCAGIPIAETCGGNEQAMRLIACANACAGVAEMGSVRELIDALTDAREVVRDRLHMAEAAGNKKDIKWASEILADSEAALAKFRLEADHE